MPLVREETIKHISYLMSGLQYEIKNRNSLKLYDGNLMMEDFCAGLLNLVYGWNLKNANSYQYDEPGIDLIDADNNIVVQVTTTRTAKKIQHSIDEFLAHNDESVNGYILYMLILGEKQKKYASAFDTKGRLEFSELQILDFPMLLNVIKTRPLEQMLMINEYLEKELGVKENNKESQELLEQKFARLLLNFLKYRRVLTVVSKGNGGHSNLQYCSESILEIKKEVISKQQEMIEQNIDTASDIMMYCDEIIIACNQYLTWMDEHPEHASGCTLPLNISDIRGVRQMRNIPGLKTLTNYCDTVNSIIMRIRERYSLPEEVTMQQLPDRLRK